MAENRIGSASIEVGADIDPLKQDVSEARAEVETLGNDGDKAGKKLGASMESAGEKIENSTAGLRKFVGALGSTVGAVTGVVGAVTGLVGALLILKNRSEENARIQREQRRAYADLHSEIEKFTRQSITSVDDLNDRFDQVVEQIDSMVDTVEKSKLNDLFDRAKLFRENNIEKAQNEDLKKLYSERGKADSEARRVQIDAAKKLSDLLEQQDISLLPDDEQVKANAERQKRIIEESFRGLGVVLSEEDLSKALANVDRIADRQIENTRKIEAEKLQLEKKRLDESERRQIEGAIKAADAFGERAQQALFGSTGAFTTQLDTILTELRNISSNQGKR